MNTYRVSFINNCTTVASSIFTADNAILAVKDALYLHNQNLQFTTISVHINQQGKQNTSNNLT